MSEKRWKWGDPADAYVTSSPFHSFTLTISARLFALVQLGYEVDSGATKTIVLITVLFLLAVFAWAGWANWEYRKQAAEKLLAHAGQGNLVPAPGGDAMNFVSPLDGKPAPAFRA